MKPVFLDAVPLPFEDGVTALDALHRSTCAISEEMFKEDGAHPPAWYLLMRDGTVRGIITPWENDREQMASRELICLLVHAFKVQAYTFVTEAYVAVIRGEEGRTLTEEAIEAERAKKPPRLEDWPEAERDEILMVLTTAADHETRHSKWLINSKGTERGRKPFLGVKVDEEYKKLEGRMTDLFERTPSDHALRAVSMLALKLGLNKRDAK